MRTRLPAASARLFLLVAGVALAVTALRPSAAPSPSAVPSNPDAKAVAHVLNRVGFGAMPGDIERVQKMGLEAYIDLQLHPERIPDEAMKARLSSFTTMTMSTHDLATKIFVPAREARQQAQNKAGNAQGGKPGKPGSQDAMDPASMSSAAAAAPPAQPVPPQLTAEARQLQMAAQNVINELMSQKVLRAAGSDRQLEEVLTDFWFNHFNVYIQKGEQERIYLTSYERDVIRKNVLGKFRDLLGATAHSPAMLFYLDNWQSVDPQAAARLNGRGGNVQMLARGRILTPQQQQAQQQAPKGLNENYGRELMELHTLGVDGGYTQQDVINVARAFTGWTINQPQQGGDFLFRPQVHDMREKLILGVKFPAGHGEDEGERVLDLLASHPATAHHIAYRLAQRFVADEPPAALVDRAAKTFLDTKGDLREVTRVILTSPEFFAADAQNAKVKSPLEFVVSAVRATGATVTNPQPMIAALRTLGMPLYGKQPPTGYSNTSEEWTNTGALLARMNFALQMVAPNQPGGGPGGRGRAGLAGGGAPQRPNNPLGNPLGRGAGPDPAMMGSPVQVDMAMLAPDTSDASRDRLIQLMFAGGVSDATRQTLAKAQTPPQLVALALGSPEFQKR